MRLIPPLGGPERRLSEIRVGGGTFVTPPYLAWCPDSSCLVVTDSPGEGKPDALFVISLESGEKRQLTHPQPPASGDTNPAVSPDGGWLVFRRSGHAVHGRALRASAGKRPDRRGRTAAPHAGRARCGLPRVDARRQGDPLFRQGRSLEDGRPRRSTPARLPFVGEDGLMPVVSRPRPGRPSRLVYVRSFEDFNVWRVETSAPGAPASSPPAVAISSTRRRQHGAAFSRRPPGGLRVGSLRRVGHLAGRSRRFQRRPAHLHGRRSHGRPALVSRRQTDCVPLQPRRPVGGLCDPRRGRQASKSHLSPGHRFGTELLARRRMDLLQLEPNGRASDMEDPGIRRGGRPGHERRRVLAPESPDGAQLYYVQTIDEPSPLWRLPTSGGVPVKVLEGVVLANFAVLEGGIYYVDRTSGQGGVHYLDRPSGVTRLQYFDFATGKATTVAADLGNTVDLPPDRLPGRPHDSLCPDGLLGRRPDAGGELSMTTSIKRFFGHGG